MKKIIFTFLFFFFCIFPCKALEQYDRKSVSVFKLNVPPHLHKKLSQKQANIIFNNIFATIKELPRFDYNPIPSRASDPKELFSIVKNYASLKVEERAKKQWEIKDEYYGASFITGENVDKIIDGAYILFPSIDDFSLAKPKPDKKSPQKKQPYFCDIKVSIKIYSATEDPPESGNWIPNLETTIFASGNSIDLSIIGDLLKLKNGGKKSKKQHPREVAFNSALSNVSQNLSKNLKEVDFFKIKALATKVNISDDQINFNFGKDVGVNLDDAYLVGYHQKQASGSKKFIETGFVKVRKVKKKNSSSQLLIVTNPDNIAEENLFNEYDQLIEYPLLGLNFGVTFGQVPLNNIETKEDNSIEEESRAFALGLDIEYNIAKLINVSEVYLHGGSAFSLANTEDAFPDVKDLKLMFLTSNLGFSKKFWIRRFAWYLGADLSYHLATGKSETNHGSEEDDDNEYYFHALGFQPNIGVNWLLSKKLFLNLKASWGFYGDLKDKDDKTVNDIFHSEEEDLFDPSGLSIYVGVSFTL